MKYFLPLFFALLLLSCGDDNGPIGSEPVEPIDYTEQNEQEIKTYIEENELNATRSDTGLYYVVSEPGEGAQPTTTSNVTVAYKGYFLDGEVFDQSADTGLSVNLQQVIAGWTEGITYFMEGGEGTLIIPAHLGYGSFDFNGIPAGSVLIFDVNLISVD